jgi:hypothetical protein
MSKAHAHYSKYACGETVCLAVDETAGYPVEERELGMITSITFTEAGVLYNVTWQDRSTGRHIENELLTVCPKTIKERRSEED